MQHVRPGDPFLMPANLHNHLVDSYNQRKLSNGGQVLGNSDRSVCWVRNDTGGDVDAFGVIGIGAVIVTYDENPDAYYNIFAFKGPKAVKATYQYKWGITMQPIKSGDIGPVRIAGLTHCFINHTGSIDFAGPDTAGHVEYLAKADCGARVLYMDAEGSAPRRAIIVI